MGLVLLAHDCLCRYVQRFVCGCWCACVHARLSPLEPPLRRRTAAAARDRFSRTSLIVTRAVAAINLIKVLWSRWYDARFTRERSRVRVPLELLFLNYFFARLLVAVLFSVRTTQGVQQRT